jgi:predicted dehydrogenase
MTTLRVYLIGAGAIARHHAGVLPKLGVDQIALSVSDTNPAVLADFVQQFPHARPVSDVASMLAEPPQPTDIVVVATPPVAHAALAGAALASGRHVLCEKPLALSLSQAQTMLAFARRHDRLLGCCSTRFLELPTTAAVKQVLRAGGLGQLYHATFVNRWQRSRPGLEYQPGSVWFLDRAQSGGGVVMDWGPYDLAVLNDLFAPVRMEVLSAWMANPTTAHTLASDIVFDVEEHAGASLRYHLADGTALAVTYERAACTHGRERIEVEIEGLSGSASWDWLMWKRRGEVQISYDQNGTLASQVSEYHDTSPLGYMDKPLFYFYQRTIGAPSPAIVNQQALFNFACLRAIYDCATTGQPQSVTPMAIDRPEADHA